MNILELKNAFSEIMNSLDKFKSRLPTREERISKLQDKSITNIHFEAWGVGQSERTKECRKDMGDMAKRSTYV